MDYKSALTFIANTKREIHQYIVQVGSEFRVVQGWQVTEFGMFMLGGIAYPVSEHFLGTKKVGAYRDGKYKFGENA